MEKKTWADFLPSDWLRKIQELLDVYLDKPLEELSYEELEALGKMLRPAWLACRQNKTRQRQKAARTLGEILGVPKDMMDCGALRHIAHKVLVVNGDIVTCGLDFARIVFGSISINEPLTYLANNYGITFDQWSRKQFEEIYMQVRGGIDRPLRPDGRVDDLLAFLTEEASEPPEDNHVKKLLKFLSGV